jgi:hypothetical protein
LTGTPDEFKAEVKKRVLSAKVIVLEPGDDIQV